MFDSFFLPRKWLAVTGVLLLVSLIVLYRTGDVWFVMAVATAIGMSGLGVRALARRRRSSDDGGKGPTARPIPSDRHDKKGT